MQRLAEVISFVDETKPTDDSRCLLTAALFADTLVSLRKSAIGQFNPGGIGVAERHPRSQFEASSRVNPWDYVFMIEGSLLLAGSVARRLGTRSSSRAVFPFSVDSVASGIRLGFCERRNDRRLPVGTMAPALGHRGSIAAKRCATYLARAVPSSVGGRRGTQLNSRLAANLLGVNRGVREFTRYGFLKRNGLAFLAAPIGRLEVVHRPKARLLDDPPLAEWIDQLAGPAPTRIRRRR